jgi:8-oxo-dGTP diphosphatase
MQSGEIVLNEHVDLKWLSVEELGSLDWAAADVPVVKSLMQA